MLHANAKKSDLMLLMFLQQKMLQSKSDQLASVVEFLTYKSKFLDPIELMLKFLS